MSEPRREEQEGGGRRQGSPRPGDLFLFRMPGALDVRWAVILPHPDDPRLLFSVPADGQPLAGTNDVRVPEEASGGPLVLRCGYGLWIHQDDFNPGLRTGALDDRHVEQARAKLAQIAGGQVEGTTLEKETEWDPDYEDWLDEVARVSDRLARRLRTRTLEVSLADFEQEGGPAERGGGPRRFPVEYNYPGSFYLLAGEDGVSVLYVPMGEQPPPELAGTDDRGSPVGAAWEPVPEGTTCRSVPAFPWYQGRVALRLGGPGGLDVTVRR
jgi:hypothetical protein